MKRLFSVGAVLVAALLVVSCSTVSDSRFQTAEVLASMQERPQDFRVFVNAPSHIDFESGDIAMKYLTKSKGWKLRTLDAPLDRIAISKAGGRQRVTFALRPDDARRFEAQQALIRARVEKGLRTAAFYNVVLNPGCAFIESLDPARKQKIAVEFRISPDVAPMPVLDLKFTGRGVPRGTKLACR